MNNYKDLATTERNRGGGLQAHHMNQNGAYRRFEDTGAVAMARDEGISVVFGGNAFVDRGTPHFIAHTQMEAFWNQYRPDGRFENRPPRNEEYGVALRESLIAAGVSAEEATNLAEVAKRHRVAKGLAEAANVPRLPGRLFQKREHDDDEQAQ